MSGGQEHTEAERLKSAEVTLATIREVAERAAPAAGKRGRDVADDRCWVRTWENGSDWIECLDGITRGDGRLPGWFHRCSPQARGRMNGDYVERCNCGAIRDEPSGPWMRRNETRIMRRRTFRD
jgi:hypothetical protein